MNTISWITAVFIAYPHEWLHYIAARSFGLKAKIKINHKKGQAYVDVRGSVTGFQTAIIAVAPIVGTVIAIFLFSQFLNWGQLPKANQIYWGIASLLLLGTCYFDFVVLWDLFKDKYE